MPNTTTAAPVFVERAPDWKREYFFDQIWTTNIFTGHDGAEQRAGFRTRPRWLMSYGPAVMRAEQYSPWKALLRRGQGAALVVPVWHFPGEFSADSANLFTPDDGDLFETMPFKVGSYAYFTGGFTSHFREITSLDGGKLLCASGDSAYPVAALPSYATLDRIYPCILGTMQDNRHDVSQRKATETEARLTIDEL